MWIGIGLAVTFTGLCGLFLVKIMGIYTTDLETMIAAGEYLSTTEKGTPERSAFWCIGAPAPSRPPPRTDPPR